MTNKIWRSNFKADTTTIAIVILHAMTAASVAVALDGDYLLSIVLMAISLSMSLYAYLTVFKNFAEAIRVDTILGILECVHSYTCSTSNNSGLFTGIIEGGKHCPVTNAVKHYVSKNVSIYKFVINDEIICAVVTHTQDKDWVQIFSDRRYN